MVSVALDVVVSDIEEESSTVDVKEGDGCGGSSSVSLAITVHSPYPLIVPARTPKI